MDLAGITNATGDIRPGQKVFPHPFPARMPFEVAQEAVRALTMPGDVVLDPMTGSGMVVRAAVATGRSG